MQRELPGLDPVAAASLGDQLLGQRTVFLARDHPGQRKAAEQVENDVQREIDAASLDRQFRDVPGPDAVGRRRFQARHCMVLGRALVAALTGTTFNTQIAMHAAGRTEIAPLLQQLGKDLEWWLIAELLAVEYIQDFLALSRREGSGLNAVAPGGLGRPVGTIAFPVGVDGAPVQPQRPAGNRQRQTCRTLFEDDLHSASPLRARSSIDKAFFLEIDAVLGDFQLALHSREILLQLLNATLIRRQGGSRPGAGFAQTRLAAGGKFFAPLLQMPAVETFVAKQGPELAVLAGIRPGDDSKLVFGRKFATGPLFEPGFR